MACIRAAALVILAAIVLFAGAPVHAQNAPITNPPTVIMPPAALPDLAVTKADATLTCVGGSQITATMAT